MMISVSNVQVWIVKIVLVDCESASMLLNLLCFSCKKIPFRRIANEC